MKHTTIPNQRQAGGILLPITFIIFFAALTAAGYITWRLWRTQSLPLPIIPPATTVGFVTPSPTDDFLNPSVVIDERLTEHTTDIQTNLITPLRQYYATRDERIEKITVSPSESEIHPAQVELVLDTPTGSTTTDFAYDYSPWEPSMLDQADEAATDDSPE